MEVLDFALGEPDFNTPANIQEAAIRAMSAGQTHYTPPAGIPELRSGGRGGSTREQHGLPTDAAQVVISNGAKHSIHNALMAVCGPGDEVIIPAPYWAGPTPWVVDRRSRSRARCRCAGSASRSRHAGSCRGATPSAPPPSRAAGRSPGAPASARA